MLAIQCLTFCNIGLDLSYISLSTIFFRFYGLQLDSIKAESTGREETEYATTKLHNINNQPTIYWKPISLNARIVPWGNLITGYMVKE